MIKSNELSIYNILGGEWIYYKIYLGSKHADNILKTKIYDLTRRLINTNIIDKWFFIRFNDPNFHIRIRFKLTNHSNILTVISEMFEILDPFIKDFSIWKVQLDTYNREVERYGFKTMLLSENLFFYDSIMVLEFLNQFNDENLKWLFALKAIDNFLDIFEYSIKEKLSLIQFLSTAFKKEYEESQIFNTSLNNKYRLLKNDIRSFMDSDENISIKKILETKNEMIYTRYPNFKKNLENILEIDLNDFLSSHIHMTMNRIFCSKNREHEMICYDFLSRYYKSKIATIKY